LLRVIQIDAVHDQRTVAVQKNGGLFIHARNIARLTWLFEL
jgi:hypothetical protein